MSLPETTSDDLIRALEARYYTDPEIYAAEMSGLLARTWQFAGHISDVEKVGDYFSFEIAGESMFCIKGRDEQIRVFYNVCQHRAHQLVSGTGNCKTLVCPYHAWTYDLAGKFRNGPNTKSVPGFKREDIRLSEARVEILCGFIFVNLDENAAPIDAWFPNIEAELRAYVPQIDSLRPMEWVEIDENCNWKVSVENYSECYHCSLNHPTFSNGVVDPQHYDIQPQGYCLRHITRSQHLDRMTYEIDTEANDHASDYSSWFLWPMFSFQVYPGNILNTYHWRAVAVDRVKVWRGWYTVDGVDSETVRRLSVQDRATTVEEDIYLVESVQRGLRSRGYRPGPLVLDPNFGIRSEHSIRALQTWMREAVGG